MSALEVMFQVPEVVEAGLNSGLLERVGGVVRDRQTKQVVMWLRDAGTHLEPEHPLAHILSLSGVVRATALVTAPLQFTGLALVAMTFERTLSALSRLETQVNHLEVQIRQEFQRGRDLEFRAALERARDAFGGKETAFRHASADTAISALIRAREEYLTELEAQLERGDAVDGNILSQLYFRAVHAHTAYLKCLLLLNEVDLAKARLNEVLPRLQRDANAIVQAGIGREPALYFHKEFPRPVLERFFAVQGWSRDPNSDNSLEPSTVFFDVLDEVREDFWNPDLIQPQYVNRMQRVLNRPRLTLAQRLQQHEERLGQAEAVIENYQRILGFALELRSLRLSMPEWDHLVDPQQLQTLGGAFILDQDYLNQLTSSPH